jgi:hypothetical protein
VRVLLDEQLPLDLGRQLDGHDVQTVSGRGWAGVRNGELLRRMRGNYDALLMMDRSLEFQQNLSQISFGIVVVVAPSNRLQDLLPLVPNMRDALSALKPGEIRRVGS